MKWLNSFSLIMRSTMTAIEEKVQDPERMLHQLICDMDEELERLRHSVAAAIADEIQLRESARRAGSEATQWHQRAEEAVREDDETRAQLALEQKIACDQRAVSLQAEHKKQKEQVNRLEASVRDLESKIRQARQKQTLLVARMARARTQKTVNHSLNSSTCSSAFSQFRRLEQSVDHEEALNAAYDRLEGRDPDAEALKQEFEEREREKRLRTELEAMRSRLGENTRE